MKIIMFYHSLISDWNHGNAHFLRGTATELVKRGNNVEVWEAGDSWSRMNLIKDYGKDFVDEFRSYYPLLKPNLYNADNPQLEKILPGADIVIVHEWNTHHLVAEIGRLKKDYGYKLFFHDTHHRAVTEPENMNNYDLSFYDGVIAFGKLIQDIYLEKKWIKKCWTIHEAADTEIFYKHAKKSKGDIIWVGNWGDEERSDEIREYLINPVKKINLKCAIYGVRYPQSAINELKDAGIEYMGWTPNYKVPEIFSEYTLTVHIPRRPYVQSLPGIPTIRPFEAMAAGIPLISTQWNDFEELFSEGEDYIQVSDAYEMAQSINELLNNDVLRNGMVAHAINTIKNRHTCVHRVDQLYSIFAESGMSKFSEKSG
jgi:spore maturation protein CgeB